MIDRLDPHWLAPLGLLGAACGPSPPTAGGTGTATSGPDDPTDPTDPTADPTTDLCAETYCGYCGDCIDGQCIYDDECCYYDYLRGGRACEPPSGCDSGCNYGYICQDDLCTPPPKPAPLPACKPAPADISQWNLGATPGAFVLADLDGDLDLDLLAAQPIPAQVELAFNDGAGGFTPGTVIPVAGALPEPALAAGDLDGDGDLDLALAPGDGGGLVLIFDNDGVHLPAPPIAAPNGADAVFIADVSVDGALDVVTLNLGKPRISVFLGDGKGGLAAEKTTNGAALTAGGSLVDLDVDKFPDLLAPHADDPTRVQIFGGGGNGSFAATDSLFKTGVDPVRRALAADLGGTADLELVALGSDPETGLAWVWPATAPETWTEPATLTPTSSPLLGGTLTDLGPDGVVDLVATTGLATVAVLRGDGAGGFGCEQVFAVAAPTDRDLLAVGDVDGDAHPDIVVGSRDGATITVIRAP